MDYKSNCIRIGLSSFFFFFFICTLHESPPCRRISPHRGVPNDPRGSFVVYPLLSLGVVTPENKSIHWTLSSVPVMQDGSPHKSRMQLTLHATRPTPHGASRLVQAMPVWSVKTRRAPSRHGRDARVYGHTTTVMHGEYTPLGRSPG